MRYYYVLILILVVSNNLIIIYYASFGKWTAERLATYLTEKTGIDLSSSQIRRILKRKKYSYIWAKYDLESKQKPIERAKFKEKLTQYLSIAREQPECLQIRFWGESGFSLRVI